MSLPVDSCPGRLCDAVVLAAPGSFDSLRLSSMQWSASCLWLCRAALPLRSFWCGPRNYLVLQQAIP